MQTRRNRRTGRGYHRGLFAFLGVLCLLVSCKKGQDAAPPDAGVGGPDVPAVSADARPAEDASPDLAPPPPEEFAVPWSEPAPAWASLSEDLADRDVGRISGEIYGKDRVVRAFIKAQCGAGALLQAVYQDDDTLRVTPAIPVRFFNLQTERSVSYDEAPFDVTVDFSEDSPTRVKGTLAITYEEEGVDKTYIDLTVDAEPLTMLLEPRMPGEGRFPEFAECHPTGWFRGTTTDGREVEGMVNASLSPDGNAVLLVGLLSPQTGFRFVVLRRKGESGPVTIDLEAPKAGAPMKIVSEFFYTPRLTEPADARGANLGEEQKVKAHQGRVTISFGTGGQPDVSLSFEELVIPMLLDGPLHGTTFRELEMEARAIPSGEYPESPGPPSWADAEQE